MNIDSIIPFWRSIDSFNGFLMNTGRWEDKKWNAIGVAIYENYASAWFGELPDDEGEPDVCGTVKVKKQVAVADTLKVNLPVAPAPHAAIKATKPVANAKVRKQVTDSAKSAPVEILNNRTEKYYIIVKSLRPLSLRKQWKI